MTTELTVTAAAGQAAAEPKNEAVAVVTPRSRSGLELGILGVLLVLAIGLGVLLVVRAERVGRAAQP